jgi:ATP-dependent Clp protease ATP-binding subunit ClpA
MLVAADLPGARRLTARCVVILSRCESELMYERFTDRAKKVIQLANEEAQRFNHEYIGTEHILLGLIKESGGVAANVLRHLGIDLRKVRLQVVRIVQSGPDMATMGKLPQTPRAKKVIEYTMEEARNLNHNYVGTEHILLGLLREEEGVAAQVLMNLGLNLKDVRAEVLRLVGRDPDIADRIRPGGAVPSAGRREREAAASNPSGYSLYSRFSERARKAMQLAYREAARLRDEYVGTHHFLLALIALDKCAAVDLLKRRKVDLQRVRSDLDRLSPASTESLPEDDLPHTPKAKKVIEFAIDESRSLGHANIGTEHILLGLLREDENPAAQILFNHGLELSEMREEVRNFRGPRET